MPDALVLDRPPPEKFAIAEPGEDRLFGERAKTLADAVITTSLVDTVRRGGADLGSEEGRALSRAALDRTMYVKLASAEDSAREEAAARRIDAIERATGQRLENPFLGGYSLEARRRVREASVNDPDYDPRGGIPAASRQIFDERVDAIMRDHPDKVSDLGLDVPLEAVSGSISAGAEERYATAQSKYQAAGRGMLGSLGAELVGGIGGGQRDPISLASWVLGPAGGVGRNVFMRMFNEGLTQGAFNLALTAAEKPIEQTYRERIGLPSGSGALTLAEGAHAFGAGFAGGMLVRGGIELGKSAIAMAKRSVRADHAMIEDRPPGVAPEAHEAAVEQAVLHAGDPAGEPPAPLVGLHASPYLFKRFDLSKVHTGQGATTYGHGVYISESSLVHEEYLREFSGYDHIKEGLPPNATSADYAARSLVQSKGGIAEARKAAQAAIDAGHAEMYAGSFLDSPKDILAALENIPEPNKAFSYRVRILADREHFLDWDKPLSEQSEFVKDALVSLGLVGDLTRGRGSKRGQTFIGADVRTKLGEMVSNENPSANLNDIDRMVSERLREAGIPGIKYLDQGSRLPLSRLDQLKADYTKTEPPKTSNFVLFDDKLAEITHINGEPLSTANPADVVETLRASPAMADVASASGQADLVDAAKLATLSDPAWQAVREGRSPPEHGLIAAEQSANPSDHAAVLDRLARDKPADAHEARLLAADEVEGLSTRREVERLTSESAKPAATPVESPEKIVGAAVQSSEGRTFAGSTHATAAANAADFYRVPDPYEKGILKDLSLDGFLTSRGRYVSREEALQIATRAEQAGEFGQAGETRLRGEQLHNLARKDRERALDLANKEFATPEKIESAAIRSPDGRVFSAQTHGHASFLAEDAGADISKISHRDSDGFVTSTGRFVSREEATEIAKRADQIDQGAAQIESDSFTKPGSVARLGEPGEREAHLGDLIRACKE